MKNENEKLIQIAKNLIVENIYDVEKTKTQYQVLQNAFSNVPNLQIILDIFLI